MISYSNWLDWKAHPVTKLFYDACLERQGEAIELMANTAGLDMQQDNFHRGFVYAYREIMEFRVEEDMLEQEKKH